MTLASGSHVKIGSDEFYLEEVAADHYIHALADAQTFFSVQEGGPRAEHATLYHNIRYWFMNDWQGGENFQYWGSNPDNDGYDQGQLNARQPGVLTSTPAVTTATLTSTGNNGRVRMANGSGRIWVASGQSLWRSANGGASWNAQTVTTAGLGAGWQITALAGDGPFLYVFVTDQPGTGVNGNARIYRFDSSNTQVTVWSSAAAKDVMGMVHSGGYLYRWTGMKLRAYDVTDASAFPLADSSGVPPSGTLAYKVTDEATSTFPTYGACVAGGEFVYFMSAWNGTTKVWAYGLWEGTTPVGREIWTLPEGFTAQDICYHSGLLYVGGWYQNRACFFVMSTQTQQAAFVDYIRPWQVGNIWALGVGPGSQLLIYYMSTTGTPAVYVYDYQTDGITYLDTIPALDINVLTVGALTTATGYRLGAFVYSGATYGQKVTTAQWDHDHNPTSVTNATHYSPAWDFGFGTMPKTFLGLELQTRPLQSGDSVLVEYKKEEDGIYNTFPSAPSGGTWTTIGTMSFASDGAATTKYFDLSSSAFTFRRLRFRFTVNGKPAILGVAGRVWIQPRQETFTLLLRLRDEHSEGATVDRRRPSGKQRHAQDMRANLWTNIRARVPVTFLDGYAYKNKPGEYDTYTVVIEDPGDNASTVAQGVMKVVLRRVDSAGL